LVYRRSEFSASIADEAARREAWAMRRLLAIHIRGPWFVLPDRGYLGVKTISRNVSIFP